ncbi:MAG: Carbohydrate kinase, PfkB family [Cytophagales bacterium]|jgi:adenosine kinase|nr:carbohydrate kinase family protein [Bacteroidota bacterium]MBS1982458.1 carbohydrate kinase family protein [Bacteroidota bacterium]WHZ06275.1 MAG: Carbohydrate kinase, PfkB family [Cytophagales bacterium]
MKRIAIVGPIPRDHIITYQGELIQKWGCVTHPVIALSVMAGNKMEVIPVSHLRKVDLDNVKEVFHGYSGINLSHLTIKNDQGDIISLKFVDVNNRLERQTGFMDPIVPDDFKKLLTCQVFVFIPISDYEIALDTLKFLKKKSKGIIVFDAHGPTTACLVNGERQRKFWIDRDLWLPYIDVLKMNLEEAQSSWFKKEYESSDFSISEEPDRDSLRAFADHCLNHGVKAVYITVDSRGCLVYFRQRKKTVEEMVPAIKVQQVIDTTGCGDSFAGGLGFGLLQKPTDYIGAAKYGNALGALRTQGKTFDVFKPLNETNLIIKNGHI